MDDERWERFRTKRELIDTERERLASTFVKPSDSDILTTLKIELNDRSCSLEEILRRPEIRYADIARAAGNGKLPTDVAEQVELGIKYSGYIERQEAQVAQALRMEEKPIPQCVDYSPMRSLSREAKEKLTRVRPATLGQATRIPGITPADVAILTVYLEQMKNRNETNSSA